MIEDTRHTTRADKRLKDPYPIPTEQDKKTHDEMRQLDAQARLIVTTDDVQRLQLDELTKIRLLLTEEVALLRQLAIAGEIDGEG